MYKLSLNGEVKAQGTFRDCWNTLLLLRVYSTYARAVMEGWKITSN